MAQHSNTKMKDFVIERKLGKSTKVNYSQGTKS